MTENHSHTDYNHLVFCIALYSYDIHVKSKNIYWMTFSDLSVQWHHSSDCACGIDGEQRLVVDEPIMDLTARSQIWVCSLNIDTQKGHTMRKRRTGGSNHALWHARSSRWILGELFFYLKVQFPSNQANLCVNEVCVCLGTYTRVKTLNLSQSCWLVYKEKPVFWNTLKILAVFVWSLRVWVNVRFSMSRRKTGKLLIALQLHTWSFCQMGMHQQVIFISADVLALYSTFITPFYTLSSCWHFSMVASK